MAMTGSATAIVIEAMKYQRKNLTTSLWPRKEARGRAGWSAQPAARVLTDANRCAGLGSVERGADGVERVALAGRDALRCLGY
jgi:hypothetical protein